MEQWKKSELGYDENFNYIFKYKDGYFKVGILDITYSIIYDGEDAEIYYINNKAPLTIKTSAGISVILPVNDKNGDIESRKNIIYVE